MTELLIKLFIKGDLSDKKTRAKAGNLGSGVGIVCNLFLFLIKLIAGGISGSVSIIADAFNNLSDMGSSVVTLLGFKLAAKPADPDHPFGHGRMEYMSASLVSALIILVGFELFKESVGKLRAPVMPEPSYPVLIILVISILVKLWMSLFNRKLGEKSSSAALKATAQDSLNDCISTGAVLIVSVICLIFKNVGIIRYLDPVVGILVAAFIIYSGIMSLKETLDPLIGLAPDPEVVKEIERTVLSEPDFLGIHDMIIHDYGPGRAFVSLHVEVPYNVDILECHEKVDKCERDIRLATGYEAVLHTDPIVTDDETVNFAREEMRRRIAELYEGFTIHDFRMVKGEKQNNLIFDVCVPAGCKLSHAQIKASISALAKDIDSTYFCVITIDDDFTGTIK